MGKLLAIIFWLPLAIIAILVAVILFLAAWPTAVVDYLYKRFGWNDAYFSISAIAAELWYGVALVFGVWYFFG
jgi:hypothetical protein